MLAMRIQAELTREACGVARQCSSSLKAGDRAPESKGIVLHRPFGKPQAMPRPPRRLNHVLRRGDRLYAVGTSRPEGLAVRTARREIATRKFGEVGSR